jgi:hypothetical protein
MKQWAANSTDDAGENAADLPEEAFEQAYEAPQEAKDLIGPDPILLSKITFRGLDSDQPKIALEPEKGAGLELGYDPKVVQVLLHLLEKAIEKSDWSQDLHATDPSLYH